MKIKTADFAISNTDISKCPRSPLPEFAFIGRSNVGKSSLINMICNHKKLAHTSGKPGKTRLINHFLINKNWYLVDLPGYGYAKASKVEKAGFEDIITNYVLKRENLSCLVVLIDSRLEPQKIDLEFLEWVGENNIPFAIMFTKCDKLNLNNLNKSIQLYERTLSRMFDELPNIIITSAETGDGKEEVLEFISSVIDQIKENAKVKTVESKKEEDDKDEEE